jgi:hypothetical protein
MVYGVSVWCMVYGVYRWSMVYEGGVLCVRVIIQILPKPAISGDFFRIDQKMLNRAEVRRHL